jgi:flagellar export protein FliJ
MSLKSILQYRQHLENMAREELLSITQALTAQLSAISRLENELQRIVEKIAGSQQETVLANEALALYRLADGMSADLATGRRLAETLKMQKEANQGHLLSAARECRITEKLGARRDRERLAAESRKEQKSNDEGSLHRWQALAETTRGGNFLPRPECPRTVSRPPRQRRDDQKASDSGS